MSTSAKSQAARLREARLAAGFQRAAEAIRRHNFNQSTYMAHENGQNGLKPDTAKLYAKAYKVEAAWLLTGEGEGPRHLPAKAGSAGIVEFDGGEFTPIGRYDASFSAGPGSLLEAAPEPLGFHLVETQWLRALTHASPEALAVVRVNGDSMKSTLEDGDWVLIDRSQRRIAREGIYAIQVLDNAWVKRLSLNIREKLVRIISDNPVVPMQELAEDELVIVGRVISLVSRRIA